MTEYLSFVFAVSFLAALGGALIYGADGDGASRTALSVILLFAVLSPLPSLISEIPTISLPSIPDGTVEGDAEYIRVTESAFEEGIAEMLAERYSLLPESFAVKLYGFDFSGMRAERIIVTLRGTAVTCDPLAVERYINSLDIGECHAEVGI